MKHKVLYRKLIAFTPKLVGEKTPNQIMYWVRKMLSPYNIKVNKYMDTNNKSCSALTVGGFYDPSLEKGEKDIEMFVMFNVDEPKVTLTENAVRVMVNEIFKTFVHEKRHRYQFHMRGMVYGKEYKCRIITDNKKLIKELEYYGDPDEVDAYAQEAAIELRLHGHSDTLAKYKELFDKNDRKVYNSFLKKFYRYNTKITL